MLTTRDGYEIDDDPARLDLDVVHGFLANESYWAKGRPRDLQERAVAGSLNLGLYLGNRGSHAGHGEGGGEQVGYTRLVTDRATFAWVCDVFVLPAHRGRGLGHWLVETALGHPDLGGMRRFLLATADAHGVYAGAGFTPLADPGRWMERFRAS